MSATVSPVIGEASVQELREAVRGEVFAPGDEGYEEACHIWNGMFDGRRPAVIVRCAGVADVIAAVGFARSNNLPLAVRGGGHSIAGFSSCDDGVVIDLGVDARGARRSRDAASRTSAAGAVWADVDHETQAHGLATTGGLVSTHRRRRLHARRRHRLADAQARARARQPRRRGRRHRRRAARPRERRRRTPSSSGGCAAAAGTSAS